MKLILNKKEFENVEFISVREAAQILGLAPKTVHNRKGGTEHLLRIRQGGKVQLIREEVERYKAELIEEAKEVRRMIYY